MTDGQLVILPGVIALFVATRFSVRVAFFYVYLPALLLLPDYYSWVSPMFPEPTFNQMAVLPVALFFLLRHGARWRWSLSDAFVILFSVAIGYSQFVNAGYPEAQNLFFDMLTYVIAPYMLVKGLVQSEEDRVAFAKCLVVLLGLVAISNIYESRMQNSFFRAAFIPFFPAYQAIWGTFPRWGLGRAAGPFGHAILCGIILGSGALIQTWLTLGHRWKGLARSWGLLGTLLVGLLLTLSRGPWVAFIVGASAACVGHARHRAGWLAIFIVFGLFVGGPVYATFLDYVTLDSGSAESFTQATAAYRRQLWPVYTPVIMESKAWGYGQDAFPKVGHYPSIDNHWLLVALNHGLISLGLLLAILLWTMIRLLVVGLRAPPRSDDAMLAFTLLGVYALYITALTTVYMGLQCVPLFFMITGWSESFLMRQGMVKEVAQEEAPFNFRRVLA